MKLIEVDDSKQKASEITGYHIRLCGFIDQGREYKYYRVYTENTENEVNMFNHTFPTLKAAREFLNNYIDELGTKRLVFDKYGAQIYRERFED